MEIRTLDRRKIRKINILNVFKDEIKIYRSIMTDPCCPRIAR